ncbi:MAG: GTPase HflX [Sandaracinaceae bacterium]|nr:GTPase HflX [Sandaracinaceae bacterium]
MEIHGNTTGLAPADLKALERIYRRKVPFEQLLTPELARSLCEVSHATGRQAGVLVDRKGVVEFVIVGDATTLWLPDFGRLRAARGRFRGLRLIHTHLGPEGLTRDDIVDLTRLRLDLVAVINVGADGQPRTVHYGHNVPVPDDGDAPPYETVGPIPYGKLDVSPAQLVGALEEEFARQQRSRAVDAKDGRAILVHVTDRRGALHAEESLHELEELARTAGVDVADVVLQVRPQIDPKFVLGRGKVDEVVLRAMQLDVEVLIFDRNLTPAQGAALARVTDLKILDRTQLILDIFAQRAESRDGKLQVELAQMKYLLPRLGTKDDSLSRLTGGIGGRGPGETKLEIGRRRARERVTRLEAELKSLGKQRKQRRSRRGRRDVPIVSIVGYTNAGKSTLLNALTGADTVAEDKLFATLDTRSRRIRFPREREVVITDTVGFIRELPKELFAAFRATFEEAQDADLLLHVVDVSDPAIAEHVRATEEILGKLELATMPRLTVFNKRDRLPPGEAERIAAGRGPTVSALDRTTLRPLLEAIERHLWPLGEDRLVEREAPDERAPDELEDHALDDDLPVAAP